MASARRADTLPAPGGRWVDPAGMGGSLDRTQATTYHPGDPVDQWLADALLECHPIARRIAAREGEECTREGYDVTGPALDPGLGDAIEAACDGDGGMGLLGHLADARTWARAYGGGALVLFVDDGRPADQPIDRQNIRRVNGVMSADRWELTVQQWAMDRREGLQVGAPRLYQFNLNHSGGGQMMRVHASRVIRVRGLPLPRRLTMRRQGWDGSIFDQCFAAIRDRDTTLLQIAEAVRMLNVGTLTTPSLNAAVETDGGAEAFMARLELLRATSGMYGDIGLGMGETYEIKTRTLGGLGEAAAAMVNALVAAADGMPRLVLLGEVTAGFSNASDGEMRSWYDQCAARQPKIYTPAIRAVIDLVLLSHEGPTQGRLVPYEVEWRPLYQLSEAERAALDLQRAQRRQVDIASRVVSPEQAQRGDPSVVELYGDLEPPLPDPMEEPLEGDEPLVDAPDEPGESEGVVSLTAAPPSSKPIPPDLLTTAAAGEIIGVKSQRVRSMMRKGVLPYWDFDGDWRCSAADLATVGQRHVV
jgi:phage-related protein (TIGR01555 family)